MTVTVDPAILTAKAIILVFVAAQVFSHIFVWPRLPNYMRCEGFVDRVLLSMMTFIATIFGSLLLYGAYFMVFTW